MKKPILAILPAIVFLLSSCDIEPMADTIIQDPVTVRFYSGGDLFREVTVERGADVPMPIASPEKEAHDFLHWYRTTSGGEERAYAAGQVLRTEGMPAEMDTVKMHARFQFFFPHEVSNVEWSAIRNPDDSWLTQANFPHIVIVTWKNPVDADFSNVEFDPEPWQGGGGTIKTSMEANSITLHTDLRGRGMHTFRIIAVDIHGNRSRGVEVTGIQYTPPSAPDW